MSRLESLDKHPISKQGFTMSASIIEENGTDASIDLVYLSGKIIF